MNCNKCGKEIANIQTASCTNFVCKKCGSTEYEIKDKSNGTGIAHGLYCAKCGFWHKWLGKEELKQYATKESKDEIIAKLQSENAALRERLEKAVELPCKIGDTVYGIGFTDCDDRTETAPKIKKKIFNTCLIMGGHCEKCKYGHMAIEEFVCTHIQIGENGIMGSNVLVVGEKNENYHSENVFTTREAAEARLAELKGGKQ